MKILCVSDQLDPLIYSNSIKERFSDVDLVLCAGDLPMEYVDFIVSSLNVPTLFVFGNHNLDDFYFYHPNERSLASSTNSVNKFELNQGHGAIYAGFKLLRLKVACRKTPLLVAGASGSIKYNDGLCQYTDRGMKLKLLKLIPGLLYNKIRYGRFLDIFLAHSPPRHIQDREDPCHKGFYCYRWFLEKFKPTYMIHGHIHLYDLQTPRVAEYCNTTIINVFSHYLLYSTKEEK
ncbi:MAG: metallophosphoesterase [Spirochaetaceae bacterium]|nr:metallophosphoesterase [Spirochaetaceae bacterium]